MSSWTSALGVVESLAPTIASCIGGPLAGGAVSALERVFGLTPAPTATTDDRTAAVAAAIEGATPEQLAAIRKADQDYDLAMKAAGFKDIETLAALKVQDVVSARTMQTTDKSWTPPLLTLVITVGFFTLLGMLFFVQVPDANKPVIYSCLGTLGTVWLVACHFWFGSTSDTAQVNNLLASSTPAAAQ
jgi:hypothetical protein